MEANTKDLRLHTAELLAATDRGEEIIITYRGKPRARLSGLKATLEEGKPIERNAAFGLWADRDEDVDIHLRRLRQGRRFD